MNVEKPKSVSFKLIYSAIITFFLPFIHGIQILSTTKLPNQIEESLKAANNGKFPNLFSISFFASFISNIIFYNIQTDCRITFSLCSLFYSLAAFFDYFANNLYFFYISRVFVGFAGGIISNIIPCYFSLISPLNIRGLFSSLYTIGLVGGLLFINILHYSFIDYYYTIRLVICAFFLILPIFYYFCIPYTNSTSKTSLISLISNKKAFKSLFLVVLFHFVQNFSGINQLALNPKSIYGDNYLNCLNINYSIGLITGAFSSYFLEYFGRKSLLITSSFILLLSSLVIFSKIDVFYSSYVFSFGFNFGLSSIPYVVLGELFPVEYIAPGALIGTSVNWISAAISMLIPQGSPKDLYNYTFLGYSGILAVFILIVMGYFKETKGQVPSFQ